MPNNQFAFSHQLSIPLILQTIAWCSVIQFNSDTTSGWVETPVIQGLCPISLCPALDASHKPWASHTLTYCLNWEFHNLLLRFGNLLGWLTGTQETHLYLRVYYKGYYEGYKLSLRWRGTHDEVWKGLEHRSFCSQVGVYHLPARDIFTNPEELWIPVRGFHHTWMVKSLAFGDWTFGPSSHSLLWGWKVGLIVPSFWARPGFSRVQPPSRS